MKLIVYNVKINDFNMSIVYKCLLQGVFFDFIFNCYICFKFDYFFYYDG